MKGTEFSVVCTEIFLHIHGERADEPQALVQFTLQQSAPKKGGKIDFSHVYTYVGWSHEMNNFVKLLKTCFRILYICLSIHIGFLHTDFTMIGILFLFFRAILAFSVTRSLVHILTARWCSVSGLLPGEQVKADEVAVVNDVTLRDPPEDNKRKIKRDRLTRV